MPVLQIGVITDYLALLILVVFAVGVALKVLDDMDWIQLGAPDHVRADLDRGRSSVNRDDQDDVELEQEPEQELDVVDVETVEVEER